ncbi:MAG: glutathione S-transferase family protein [Myxococcales bacterium]|nr:glutathione S-transferase family protein [Myxococcota bacterium]MDW8280562.1 glutathione S-transferase family protein [Myxococcales bacterium]
MKDEIIFYTNPRSRGAIVHWMLEEVGCPYRVQVVPYGPPMKSPEYLAINPMGKVPALRHGAEVVTETAAICAYLADAFPEAGLAPPPPARGAYYRWLFFAAGCLDPALIHRSAGWEPTPEMQGRLGYGTLEQTLEALAGWLRGRRYIVNDRFSAADVYVASLLEFSMTFQLVPRRPEFEEYVGPLLARPARQRAQEQIQRMEVEPQTQGS